MLIHAAALAITLHTSTDRLLLILEGIALLRDTQQWNRGRCLESVG